jgi:hypothetical protein
MTRSKSPTRCNSVTEFILPLMSIVQCVSSVMSLIIRNLKCIWASGLQTLVETASGAVWVPTQTAPRAVSTSVCKPEAQIQLRFLMMCDITLETRWTIDISGIINSVTELHLVGDLLLALKKIFICTLLLLCGWIFRMYRWYALLTYMTVVNAYFTLYYFYIFVCFVTCSTPYCLVTVSGIHGMYIVLYCIVLYCKHVTDMVRC